MGSVVYATSWGIIAFHQRSVYHADWGVWKPIADRVSQQTAEVVEISFNADRCGLKLLQKRQGTTIDPA